MSTQVDHTNDWLARLRNLAPEQVAMIDEALGRVGAFGEVRLKVEKGRLRFICVEQSLDARRGMRNSEFGMKNEE